jgi:hypothetical protein
MRGSGVSALENDIPSVLCLSLCVSFFSMSFLAFLRDVRVEGRIILQWILEKLRGYELDSGGSG